MKNKKKAAMAIISAVSAVGTAAALDIALKKMIGRKDTLHMSSKKGFLGQVSRGLNRHKDAIDSYKRHFDAIPKDKVKITACDGVELTGHWIQADDPRRTLVMMHGFRSAWDRDFCGAVEFFRGCGCNLLLPEQRAHGESGGEYIGYGILERFDCAEWLKYADLRCGGSLPVYAHGMSMGGTTVLMASELELPDSVVGIISDCGFTSPADILAHILKNGYHLPEKPILPLLSGLCKGVAGYGFYDRSTVDALQNNTRPVLLIHGEDDGFVPCSMSRRNFDAARGYKEIVTVPGAGHGLSYIVDREKCEKALLGFFNKCEN